METSAGIKILPAQLEPETLNEVIEEFVTRDGTNLAEAETKVRQVRAALDRGTVELWFDAQTRTCNIVVAPR